MKWKYELQNFLFQTTDASLQAFAESHYHFGDGSYYLPILRSVSGINYSTANTSQTRIESMLEDYLPAQAQLSDKDRVEIEVRSSLWQSAQSFGNTHREALRRKSTHPRLKADRHIQLSINHDYDTELFQLELGVLDNPFNESFTARLEYKSQFIGYAAVTPQGCSIITTETIVIDVDQSPEKCVIESCADTIIKGRLDKGQWRIHSRSIFLDLDQRHSSNPKKLVLEFGQKCETIGLLRPDEIHIKGAHLKQYDPILSEKIKIVAQTVDSYNLFASKTAIEGRIMRLSQHQGSHLHLPEGGTLNVMLYQQHPDAILSAKELQLTVSGSEVYGTIYSEKETAIHSEYEQYYHASAQIISSGKLTFHSDYRQVNQAFIQHQDHGVKVNWLTITDTTLVADTLAMRQHDVTRMHSVTLIAAGGDIINPETHSAHLIISATQHCELSGYAGSKNADFLLQSERSTHLSGMADVQSPQEQSRLCIQGGRVNISGKVHARDTPVGIRAGGQQQSRREDIHQTGIIATHRMLIVQGRYYHIGDAALTHASQVVINTSGDTTTQPGSECLSRTILIKTGNLYHQGSMTANMIYCEGQGTVRKSFNAEFNCRQLTLVACKLEAYGLLNPSENLTTIAGVQIIIGVVSTRTYNMSSVINIPLGCITLPSWSFKVPSKLSVVLAAANIGALAVTVFAPYVLPAVLSAKAAATASVAVKTAVTSVQVAGNTVMRTVATYKQTDAMIKQFPQIAGVTDQLKFGSQLLTMAGSAVTTVAGIATGADNLALLFHLSNTTAAIPAMSLKRATAGFLRDSASISFNVYSGNVNMSTVSLGFEFDTSLAESRISGVSMEFLARCGVSHFSTTALNLNAMLGGTIFSSVETSVVRGFIVQPETLFGVLSERAAWFVGTQSLRPYHNMSIMAARTDWVGFPHGSTIDLSRVSLVTHCLENHRGTRVHYTSSSIVADEFVNRGTQQEAGGRHRYGHTQNYGQLSESFIQHHDGTLENIGSQALLIRYHGNGDTQVIRGGHSQFIESDESVEYAQLHNGDILATDGGTLLLHHSDIEKGAQVGVRTTKGEISSNNHGTLIIESNAMKCQDVTSDGDFEVKPFFINNPDLLVDKDGITYSRTIPHAITTSPHPTEQSGLLRTPVPKLEQHSPHSIINGPLLIQHAPPQQIQTFVRTPVPQGGHPLPGNIIRGRLYHGQPAHQGSQPLLVPKDEHIISVLPVTLQDPHGITQLGDIKASTSLHYRSEGPIVVDDHTILTPGDFTADTTDTVSMVSAEVQAGWVHLSGDNGVNLGASMETHSDVKRSFHHGKYKVTRSTHTVAHKTTIASAHGGEVISKHGKLRLTGVDVVSAKKLDFYAEEGIESHAVVETYDRSEHSVSVWGHSHRHRSHHEHSIANHLSSDETVSVTVGDGHKLDIPGTVIHGKLVRAHGDSLHLGRTLEHHHEQTSDSGVSLNSIAGVPIDAHGRFFELWIQQDPWFIARLNALGAKTSLDKVAASTSIGIESANLLWHALNAKTLDQVCHDILQREHLGGHGTHLLDPLAQVGIGHHHEDRRYQTLGEGGIDADDVQLDLKSSLELENGAAIKSKHGTIHVPHITLNGRTLTLQQHSSGAQFTVDVSLRSGVAGVGANASHQELSHEDDAIAAINIDQLELRTQVIEINSGVILTNELTGEVGSATIRSRLANSQSFSAGGAISTSGQFSLQRQSQSSQTVATQSAIISKDASDFHLGTAKLIGSQLVGVNADHVDSIALHGHSHSQGFSVTAPFNLQHTTGDLIPTLGSIGFQRHDATDTYDIDGTHHHQQHDENFHLTVPMLPEHHHTQVQPQPLQPKHESDEQPTSESAPTTKAPVTSAAQKQSQPSTDPQSLVEIVPEVLPTLALAAAEKPSSVELPSGLRALASTIGASVFPLHSSVKPLERYFEDTQALLEDSTARIVEIDAQIARLLPSMHQVVKSLSDIVESDTFLINTSLSKALSESITRRYEDLISQGDDVLNEYKHAAVWRQHELWEELGGGMTKTIYQSPLTHPRALMELIDSDNFYNVGPYLGRLQQLSAAVGRQVPESLVSILKVSKHANIGLAIALFGHTVMSSDNKTQSAFGVAGNIGGSLLAQAAVRRVLLTFLIEHPRLSSVAATCTAGYLGDEAAQAFYRQHQEQFHHAWQNLKAKIHEYFSLSKDDAPSTHDIHLSDVVLGAVGIEQAYSANNEAFQHDTPAPRTHIPAMLEATFASLVDTVALQGVTTLHSRQQVSKLAHKLIEPLKGNSLPESLAGEVMESYESVFKDVLMWHGLDPVSIRMQRTYSRFVWHHWHDMTHAEGELMWSRSHPPSSLFEALTEDANLEYIPRELRQQMMGLGLGFTVAGLGYTAADIYRADNRLQRTAEIAGGFSGQMVGELALTAAASTLNLEDSPSLVATILAGVPLSLVGQQVGHHETLDLAGHQLLATGSNDLQAAWVRHAAHQHYGQAVVPGKEIWLAAVQEKSNTYGQTIGLADESILRAERNLYKVQSAMQEGNLVPSSVSVLEKSSLVPKRFITLGIKGLGKTSLGLGLTALGIMKSQHKVNATLLALTDVLITRLGTQAALKVLVTIPEVGTPGMVLLTGISAGVAASTVVHHYWPDIKAGLSKVVQQEKHTASNMVRFFSHSSSDHETTTDKPNQLTMRGPR